MFARLFLPAVLFCLLFPSHLLAADLELLRAERPVHAGSPAVDTTRPGDRATTELIRVLDHVSPRTPARLWEVMRRHARSPQLEAVFFDHPAFATLGAAEQRELYRLIATESPRRFLRMSSRLEPDSERDALLHGAIERLEERLIARVAERSLRDQLGHYLGDGVPAKGLGRGAKKLLAPENRIDRMLSDPSLDTLDSIQDEWFRGLLLEHLDRGLLYVNAREFVQCKIMIARNLFLKGEPASPAGVRHEYRRILELRRTYRDFELFSGRNVVYAASQERARKDGPYVFGQGRARRDLERQGANVLFLRKGEEADTGSIKRRLNAELADAPQLTFLFEGHGRSQAIQVGSGLAAARVADRIAARPDSDRVTASTSILILMTCRGHDYSRSILRRLQADGADTPKPIIIVPEEYGQSYVTGLHTSPFLSQDLQLGNVDSTTLGTVIDNGRIGASVYVPDENNLPAQIL